MYVKNTLTIDGGVAKYGLLYDTTLNIGDAIQNLAASRFLPCVDAYIQRERVSRFTSCNDCKYKLIMNAWWMHDKRAFPPSVQIEPLLISMHIYKELRSTFLTNKTKKLLCEYGPVGCRDENTRDYLLSNGVPAYFSGCMTLTLQRNYNIPRKDYVLCVDVPSKVVEEIKTRTKRPVISLSKNIIPSISIENKFRVAKAFLRFYHDAHCVISPNLHTAMPSLAMQTPVLRLDIGDDFDSVSRFCGLDELVNKLTVAQFMSDKLSYNIENPPANPDKHLELRDKLIQRCSDFTGYNREESLILESDDTLLDLMMAFQYDYNANIEKACFYVKPLALIKTFFLRLFKIKNRFDG